MNKNAKLARTAATAAYYRDPGRSERVSVATDELATYLTRLLRPNQDWAGLNADDLINVTAEAIKRTLSRHPAGQAAAISLAQELFERTNRNL